MNLSTGWRANKPRRARVQSTRKPKIRWEVLGLPKPLDTRLTTSMDDIRRQVSNLASHGLSESTRSVTAAAIPIKVSPISRSKRHREALDPTSPRR
jgi:hypothetical protein